MAHKENDPHLAKVKQQLADKYYSLAKVAGSKPKKRTFQNKGDRYSRQAEQIRRG